MRVENLPGLSHAEIARRLGISATRVIQIERRALAKLKRGLKKLGVHSCRPVSE
jgi:DNA-directed RNA polymerase specialized sigma subunit